MGLKLFVFTLLLIKSTYCQIDSPEDARSVACSLSNSGLSGDPQCALSAARFVLAGQGINQTLTINDLNELCTATPCAQLIDLRLKTITSCEDVTTVSILIVYTVVNPYQQHNIIIYIPVYIFSMNFLVSLY